MRLAASERTLLTLLADESPRFGLELVAASSGRRLYEPTALGHRALLAARIFSGEISIDGAAS